MLRFSTLQPLIPFAPFPTPQTVFSSRCPTGPPVCRLDHRFLWSTTRQQALPLAQPRTLSHFVSGSCDSPSTMVSRSFTFKGSLVDGGYKIPEGTWHVAVRVSTSPVTVRYPIGLEFTAALRLHATLHAVKLQPLVKRQSWSFKITHVAASFPAIYRRSSGNKSGWRWTRDATSRLMCIRFARAGVRRQVSVPNTAYTFCTQAGLLNYSPVSVGLVMLFIIIQLCYSLVRKNTCIICILFPWKFVHCLLYPHLNVPPALLFSPTFINFPRLSVLCLTRFIYVW